MSEISIYLYFMSESRAVWGLGFLMFQSKRCGTEGLSEGMIHPLLCFNN